MKVEPKVVVTGSFIRYERKRGISNKYMFLNLYLNVWVVSELIRGWVFQSLDWQLVI